MTLARSVYFDKEEGNS